MTEAIFGLVGVVIGGLLNGGVTWLTERKSLRSRAMVAARLVKSEFVTADVAIDVALSNDSWADLTVGISVTEWNQHRETLAAVLDEKEWASLEVYASISGLIAIDAEVRKGEAIGESYGETLKNVQSRAQNAIACLDRYLSTF